MVDDVGKPMFALCDPKTDEAVPRILIAGWSGEPGAFGLLRFIHMFRMGVVPGYEDTAIPLIDPGVYFDRWGSMPYDDATYQTLDFIHRSTRLRPPAALCRQYREGQTRRGKGAQVGKALREFGMQWESCGCETFPVHWRTKLLWT